MYWQMVGSVIVGYLMFAEVPDAFVWLGSAMIIGAGIWVGLRGTGGRAAATTP
jgi:drug/metabolite transporter (DMT)-like permease